MGRRRTTTTMKPITKSHTLPSSPTHSSSSSDFEFTVSLSPPKSTAVSSAGCPADDLFYKGQLLPLHLSPRLSMVRTLLLSSASTSSSSTATSASRPSSGSSTDCDSSRPSSAAAEDDHHHSNGDLTARLRPHSSSYSTLTHKKPNKYFSLSRFSSVFKPKPRDPDPDKSGSSVKRISTTAREVICKYLKKVKPLYEKLSQKQRMETSTAMATETVTLSVSAGDGSVTVDRKERERIAGGAISYSFSGNLRYPRRRSCVSSCPSSMRSSPSHSGILARNGGTVTPPVVIATSSSSSMEELQSAIQGAIAHCKNSMSQSKSNEI